MEPSSPPLMEPLGLQGLLGLQTIFMMSLTEIAPLWQWVIQEPFLHRLMVPHGLQVQLLVELQIISMESPTLNNLPPP